MMINSIVIASISAIFSAGDRVFNQETLLSSLGLGLGVRNVMMYLGDVSSSTVEELKQYILICTMETFHLIDKQAVNS